MNFKLKPLHIVSLGALVVGIILLTALFVGNTEKQTIDQYEHFKESLGLTDFLQEDDVHYSLLSRTLVIENPSIKLSPEQFGGNNTDMIRGILGLANAGLAQQQESALGAAFTRSFEALTFKERIALSFGAKELRIKRSGDEKDGELSLEFRGVDLSRPYLTSIANELVSPVDNPDELAPLPGLDQYGFAMRDNHRWYHNAVNKIPGSGSFLIDALGLYGSTLDAKLDISRSDDGEGEILLTMTHRVDGSEVGRIERKAVFVKMPELDEVVQVAEAYIKGYALVAMGAGRVGVMATSLSGEKFLRDSKLESYDLSFTGYEDLEDSLADADSKDAAKVSRSCAILGISSHELTVPKKAKVRVDDSNCAIAVSLAQHGKYTESYRFNEAKTAYSELMINESYEVEIN